MKPLRIMAMARKEFIHILRDLHPVMLEEIATSGLFTDAAASTVDQAVSEYLVRWKIEHEDYGAAV